MSRLSNRGRTLRLAALLPTAVVGALIALPTTSAEAVSTTIAINEVYGGGGNTGAPLKSDFIELHNVSDAPVSLDGSSVQYASSSGSSWQVTNLSGTLVAGGYYLVKEADGTGTAAALPTPDSVGTIAMSAANGKVALVNGTVALTCGTGCTTLSNVTDFFGYGTANDFESAPAPALTNTTSAARTTCLDHDNNSTDFSAGAPAPQNTASTPVICDVEPPPPPSECENPATLIHDVQGAGTSSPLVGTSQTIEGVVTAAMFGGVFVQEEASDVDADPLTSEGIFVTPGGSPAPTVGSVVHAAGSVTENFGRTQLNSATLEVCGAAETPIASTPVTFPLSAPGDLERYEDMLVQLTDTLVISEYFNYDRFGEVVAALPPNDWDRLYTPTAVAEPGAAANALAAEYKKRIITIDDRNGSQNPSSIPHPGNGQPFSLENRFRGGDTIQGVQGILDFQFSLYRLQPTAYGTYTVMNDRPATPPDVGGTLKVASSNVLNYFLTLAAGTNRCGPLLNQDCRGANDATELQRQRAKILAALAGMDADVVGLMEMENSPGVEPAADLAAGLNNIFGAGTYAYINTGVVGGDAIRLGLLYKPAKVQPVGAFDIFDSSDDSRFIDTRNRPMLTQTFDEVGTGARFTVSVNHLKSKGSACAGDPDTGDGQGNCNVTRTQAAEAIVDHLATDPTGSGDPDHLVIGDLNAYDHEDPIKAFEAGGYEDQIKKLHGDLAYSYVFDGQAGYLDHALANSSLAGQVTGAEDWHINADEPDILDYDTSFKPAAVDAIYAPDQFRASDHDPVLIGLDLLNTATSLSATAEPSEIVFGGSSTVGGALTETAGGASIAGATVSLESQPAGSSGWTATGDTATTAAGGSYSFAVSPQVNTSYRVEYAGGNNNAASESNVVAVNVATRVELTVSNTTAKKGATILFTGIVAPSHAGQAVQLQRLVGGEWQQVDTATLTQDSTYNLFWTVFQKEKKGTSQWRVVKPADADHVQGVSRVVSISVR